jgi:beta-phosphoglucomutase-like phosphatase (HAD superfamily)
LLSVRMIKAVVFDLDNTLVDFMAMKRQSVSAAINSMIDAGLKLSPEEVQARIDAIYKERGIEFQNVFDQLLYDVFQKVDYKILSAGIIAYRRAREAALVPYPHVNMTLVQLVKRGLKLAVISDAPGREAWLRLCYLSFRRHRREKAQSCAVSQSARSSARAAARSDHGRRLGGAGYFRRGTSRDDHGVRPLRRYVRDSRE